MHSFGAANLEIYLKTTSANSLPSIMEPSAKSSSITSKQMLGTVAMVGATAGSKCDKMDGNIQQMHTRNIKG